MPSTIIYRAPGGTDDKRLRLVNAQFGRPFDIGAWTKLRIALRLGFTSQAASPVGTINFFIGLCNGTTNMMGDATCDHAVGFGTNGSWTKVEGGGTTDSYNVGSLYWFTKVGTTLTTHGVAVGSGGAGAAANTTGLQRDVLFLDYTKGATWTLNSFFRQASSGAYDVSREAFLALAEIESGMTQAAHSVGTTKSSIDVDEGFYGALNTVHVWWPRSTPVMEISDIALVRFA